MSDQGTSVASILDGMYFGQGMEAVQTWISQNLKDLSEGDLQEVVSWVADKKTTIGLAGESAALEGGPGSDDTLILDAIQDTVKGRYELIAGINEAADFDGDGTLNEEEMIAAEQAEQAAEMEEDTQEQARLLPGWILQAAGNRRLTDSEIERLEYNLSLHTNGDVTSIADPRAFSILSDQGIADPMVRAAFGATSYLPAFSVKLPSGRTYTVTQEAAVASSEMLGISQDTVMEIVRLADTYGFKSQEYEGPIYWQSLGTILKMKGLLDPLEQQVTRRENYQAGPSSYRGNTGAEAAARADRTRPVVQPPMFERRVGGFVPTSNSSWGPGYSVIVKEPINVLAQRLSTANDRYGAGLGLLYLENPDLVKKIEYYVTSGRRVPVSLLTEVEVFAEAAGFGNMANMTTVMGLTDAAFRTSSGNWVLDRIRMQADDAAFRADRAARDKALREEAAGPVRSKPDVEGIRQTVKQLYDQLLLPGLDDSMLDFVVAQITNDYATAEPGQEINQTARIRSIIQNTPGYKELYGSKPSGMPEETYANQFGSAQAKILGDQLGDLDAVRIGMRGNSYQTTIGASLADPNVLDNSTFMGRLATLARSVAEYT